MRLHYLQHVPFEDAANIAVWARQRGYPVTRTRMYEDASLPSEETFDWLVVLGGPMNAYEHDRYPWLVEEKALIRRAIDRGVTVLGVCLGAQLIADVLGGKVDSGGEREIGWFPVRLTRQAKQSRVFAVLPEQFMAFHWHEDTFSVPPGAVRTAASDACAHQAFIYGDRVVALQFHLEYTATSIEQMIRHCGQRLAPGRYVQSAEQIAGRGNLFAGAGQLLYGMLDELATTSR